VAGCPPWPAHGRRDRQGPRPARSATRFNHRRPQPGDPQANGEIGWAPQLRELLAFAKVTRIFGLDTAPANLAGVAPAEDRDVVASTLAKTFGKTVAPLALGRQA
jgi:hypothetical protein